MRSVMISCIWLPEPILMNKCKVYNNFSKNRRLDIDVDSSFFYQNIRRYITDGLVSLNGSINLSYRYFPAFNRHKNLFWWYPTDRKIEFLVCLTESCCIIKYMCVENPITYMNELDYHTLFLTIIWFSSVTLLMTKTCPGWCPSRKSQKVQGNTAAFCDWAKFHFCHIYECNTF